MRSRSALLKAGALGWTLDALYPGGGFCPAFHPGDGRHPRVPEGPRLNRSIRALHQRRARLLNNERKQVMHDDLRTEPAATRPRIAPPQRRFNTTA